LLKVQEKWLDDGVCEAPFIYKLVVHEPALQNLANWLETVGMRTFRFYPDLEYIGKEVSESVHKVEKQ